MAQTQIKQVSSAHDAILDVMLAKPWITLADLAKITGYSATWLCILKKTDSFRAEYERRRDGIECNVMASIQEKLNEVTELAIDKMGTMLAEKNLDADELTDAFDKVLKANGYAPNSKQQQGPLLQQNNFYISQDEMKELQGNIISGSARVLPEPPGGSEGSE